MTPARQYNDIFEAHERLYLVQVRAARVLDRMPLPLPVLELVTEARSALMAALAELDAERRKRS